MRVQEGHRIGRGAELQVGASGVIYDEEGRVLLTRRADNDRWCLPGGRLDSGETLAEACVREVAEETGLRCDVDGLLGIYSSPDTVVVYQDGVHRQVVAACFVLVPRGDGDPHAGPEVREVSYFAQDELDRVRVVELHEVRIRDAFERKGIYIR